MQIFIQFFRHPRSNFSYFISFFPDYFWFSLKQLIVLNWPKISQKREKSIFENFPFSHPQWPSMSVPECVKLENTRRFFRLKKEIFRWKMRFVTQFRGSFFDGFLEIFQDFFSRFISVLFFLNFRTRLFYIKMAKLRDYSKLSYE